MDIDKEKTIVVFRKFKEGDILALFPTIPYNDNPDLCMSYQHIGQHGAASFRIIATTYPAKENEYKELATELEQIGYNLDIKKRITKRWFN